METDSLSHSDPKLWTNPNPARHGGGTLCILYICNMHNVYVWDPRGSQIYYVHCSELREGSLLCSKMRLGKNFSTKKRSFGQFLIQLNAGRIRIRNLIRNFCSGSATHCTVYRHRVNNFKIDKQRSLARTAIYNCEAALRIRDILVRIQTRGSGPLTNGSGFGSGSWYFRQWPARWQLKIFLFL